MDFLFNAGRRRMACGLVVMFAGLGLTACGGGSDDDAQSTASSGGEPAAVGETPDERAAVATIKAMGTSLEKGDGAGACRVMTADARRAMVTAVADGAGLLKGETVPKPSGGCAAAFDTVLKRSSEDYDPRMLDVLVEGDTAVVASNPSHTTYPQYAVLKREQGKWRVVEWFSNGVPQGLGLTPEQTQRLADVQGGTSGG
jgi:hypothetical protein